MTKPLMTTNQISQLSAQITGGELKRSATREAAVKRFVKIARDAKLNAPEDLLVETFEDATEILHRALGSIAISVVLDGVEVASAEVAGKVETLTAEVDAFVAGEAGVVVFDAETDIPAFLRNDRSAAIDVLPEAPAPEAAPVTVKPAKAAKAPKAPKAEKPAKAPAGDKSLPKAGSKNEVMLSMASAKGGATEAEICEALGWKACLVTLRRVCEKAGYTLRTEKQKGGKARYFAEI